MATIAIPTDFINMVAAEMSSGVEKAVEYWLTQIEQIAMNDNIAPSLKLAAINGVVQKYKRLTGKGQLQFANCD